MPCRSAETSPLSWRAPTLCRALNRWPRPTGLASRAPIRTAVANGAARDTRVCTLFWRPRVRGPWHDRAGPATSRRVLATRPISLPERSALIAAPRTGTNDAFRHPALTRGAGDATIQHGALERERQPTRTWRGETMRSAARRLRAIVAGVACLAIPLAAAPLQPAFSQAAEKVTRQREGQSLDRNRPQGTGAGLRSPPVAYSFADPRRAAPRLEQLHR